ncbi:anthranilate synthase family protein [Phytohabitans suffuscus]|uniref:anthranilate synthase n=1 Tax=Phytohabitans suffuscus TaxID=624315 RepID=A0A6F8YF28_9ACTN|nr:anthranilate synthase family protein [Phytohabitans suffuscus]BCB84744.1 phenazine-specific anthranilate synthase component I [Phytohabitans suffuscus]
MSDLRSIVSNGAPAFALLSRPRAGGGDRVEVFVGDPVEVATLADLPAATDRLLAIVPYRQIRERGLACVDDAEPLVAIQVRAHGDLPVAEALRLLPRDGVRLDGGDFDIDDAAYEAVTRLVVAEHIGRGAGSNFVVRRTFRTELADPSLRARLAIFRRLLSAETGAYWTFLVHWNGRTLVGATPECHARLEGGVATMNPISGTYRYPEAGPTPAGLRRFLADRKETEELLMVVDEELKMMARVCPGGGRLRGPFLQPMSRLAHTAYTISGPSNLDARDVLRLTMPAPTVTGSPLASACRVVAEHERSGRGYYGGALALIDRHGMDAALVIRTADINPEGAVRIPVGATLVRHSDPAAEAAETRAKAAALLRALGGERAATGEPRPAVPIGYRVRRALSARNRGLSDFWRGRERPRPAPSLAGRRLLLIDAEDDFTAMLATVAASTGVAVGVQRFDRDLPTDADLVLVGPGPGDPLDHADPRIARLHRLTRDLLDAGTPFLAVCLGHQVLADELGLAVRRLTTPRQGLQKRIPLHGRPERVAFYNTFVATSGSDRVYCPFTGDPVSVVRDRATGVVHALAKPRMRSTQFHMESVLTENGPAILRQMMIELVAEAGGVATVTARGKRRPSSSDDTAPPYRN